MKMRNLFTLLSIATVMGLGYSSGALASVAANTRIVNQATLSYNDGSTVRNINASVTVTVSLVPGQATLGSPSDIPSVYGGVDTKHTYNYTITSGGNGPDSYTLSSAVSGSSNTTLSIPGSSAPALSTASVTLGASVTVSGSTATVLNVPSDGVAGSAVNGIAINDNVVVVGQLRKVTAVSNSGSGIATIALDAALSPAPAAGTPVYEQQNFALDVFSGTLSASGTNITVTVAVNAVNGAGTASDPVTSTYTSGAATLAKYVRNATTPAANAGGSGGQNFTVNGASNTYYTGGVTGKTNDLLEYVLVATNAGTGPATTCTISDVLPAEYVTFKTGAFGVGSDFAYINDSNIEVKLTQAAGDDQTSVAGANITAYVGTGATSGAGGGINPGKSFKVAYRVTIR